MKKTFFTSIYILAATLILAQEKIPQKELGFVFSDLNNFGLAFKIGNNVAMWRINTVAINNHNDNRKNTKLEENNSRLGLTLKFGRENYISIAKNIEFCLGADLIYSYYEDETDRKTQDQINNYYKSEKTHSGGASLILGFNYIVKEKLILGIAIFPGYQRFTREELVRDYNNNELKTTQTGSNFGFSSTSGQLSIAVRF